MEPFPSAEYNTPGSAKSLKQTVRFNTPDAELGKVALNHPPHQSRHNILAAIFLRFPQNLAAPGRGTWNLEPGTWNFPFTPEFVSIRVHSWLKLFAWRLLFSAFSVVKQLRPPDFSILLSAFPPPPFVCFVTTIRDSEQPVWASILWRAWEANSVQFVIKTFATLLLCDFALKPLPQIVNRKFPGRPRASFLNVRFFVRFFVRFLKFTYPIPAQVVAR
jgi:hypothetical protein